MKDSVESLMIYKQYLDYMSYIMMIVEKYPKKERYGLTKKIEEVMYDGITFIINGGRFYNKDKKLNSLISLDSNLKMMKVLVRISYKKKYINGNNYHAWAKKLSNLSLLLGGWIRYVNNY